MNPDALNQSYVWAEQTNVTSWEIELWDMFMENTSFYANHTKATIDTFFRPILIPPAEFELFTKYMNHTYIDMNVSCNMTAGNCYFLKPCATWAANFTNITFQLAGNKGLYIPPSSYLLDKKSAEGHESCLIGVQRNSEDDGRYVLGQVVLSAYLILYDQENMRIGFSGFFINDIPTPAHRQAEESFPTWAIAAIIAGIVGIVLIVIIFVCLWRKNRTTKGGYARFGDEKSINYVSKL